MRLINLHDEIPDVKLQHSAICLLGINEGERRIVFGECKYWNGQVGMNIMTALQEKSKCVRWHEGDREDIFVLFSIHGFTKELKEYVAAKE